MGLRGPVPNKDIDLARPRERKGGDSQSSTHGELLPVVIPDPSPDWLPITVMLWNSLRNSGMRDFYQDSDWAYAFLVFDEVNEYKTPRVSTKTGEIYMHTSGQMFQSIMSAMSALGMTEGDRRRMSIELEKPDEKESAAILAIADYRQALEEDSAE